MLRLIILVGALAFGGLAAWFALAAQPAPGASGPAAATIGTAVPTPEVLVASEAIAEGQALDATMTRWQPWPEGALSENLAVRSEQPDAAEHFSGMVVRSGFVAGEPIRSDKLVSGDGGFMAAILPAGKRAVAVRVSAENSAGGFILPNDRVDVIHTITVPDPEGGPVQSVSRTILRNVRVLAVDQTTSQNGAETIAVGKTATLELDPQQVEIAAAAEVSGALSLALRAILDSGETEELAQPPQETRNQSVVQMIGSGRAQLVTTKPAAGS